MARKKTRGRKVTPTASARRRTAKATEKPRKRVSRASAPKKATAPGSIESPRAGDLLQGWSPSRYSTR